MDIISHLEHIHSDQKNLINKARFDLLQRLACPPDGIWFAVLPSEKTEISVGNLRIDLDLCTSSTDAWEARAHIHIQEPLKGLEHVLEYTALHERFNTAITVAVEAVLVQFVEFVGQHDNG